MADYETDEMLTRLLAIERMKALSDLYIEALARGDKWAAEMIDFERTELRKQWITVVK